VSFVHAPSLADFITTIVGFEVFGTHSWPRAFDEPIPLPDGGELRTLLVAGRYVDKLPRSMQEREEWQMVMEVLLSAVEGREPVRLVQVALTLALQESKR
jgi:nitroreductase